MEPSIIFGAVILIIAIVAVIIAFSSGKDDKGMEASEKLQRESDDSLSSTLAWEAWHPDLAAVGTRQAGLVRVYELKAIGSAYLTAEKIDKVQETLNYLILRLLPGVSFQFIAKVDKSIEHILHSYETYRGRDQHSSNAGRQLCRDIIKITADHYRNATSEGFPLRPENRLRMTRLYLTVSIPNPKKTKRLSNPIRQFLAALVPDVATNFFSPLDAYVKLVENDLARLSMVLKQTDGAITSAFSEAGLGISRLDKKDTCNVFYQFRNPDRSSRRGLEQCIVNDNEHLNYQLDHDDVEKTRYGLKVGKKIAVVTTMSSQPVESDTGHFSKLLEHIDEGHIAINFTVQQASSISRGLSIKQSAADLFVAVCDNASDMSKGIGIFKRQMGDGSACPVSYEVTDVRYFDSNRTDPEIERERILTQWQALGGEGHTESIYAAAMWIRSMPGCFNAMDAWWDKRMQITRSQDLANMFATIWSWSGNWRGNIPECDELFVSRRNELIPISKWANEAAHGYVVGTTRTGKSFRVNHKVAHDLSCDKTNVYMLDVGDSYGALNEACGEEFAQMVYFDMEKPICFNPLYLPEKITADGVRVKVRDAALIIASMLVADPKIDKVEASRLTLLMKAAHTTMLEAQQGGYEATLTKHFIPVLKSLKMSGEDGAIVADILSPFYDTGVYAPFFDGVMEFKTDKNFVIFELGKVKDDKYLMSPLFIVVLSFLRSLFYDMPLDVRKMIYADESHNLMVNDMAGSMVNSFYAEGAKFNCWICTMTQNLFKYLDFPGGSNILGQATYGEILSQDMEQTRGKQADLGLSDLKVNAISHVSKQDDRAFSEFLYTDAIGTADERGDYLRFYSPPVLKCLYGTNADEKFIRNKLKGEHPNKSLMEIAELVLAETGS